MRGIWQTFERGASPFLRWALSPFLLLALILIPTILLPSVTAEGSTSGFIVAAGMGVACVAGLLALWGVPHAGRIVTGMVALGYAAYVYSECFIEFDGDWGVGESRADRTPMNAILGFIVFGIPCAFYTVFGRFSLRGDAVSDDVGQLECEAREKRGAGRSGDGGAEEH